MPSCDSVAAAQHSETVAPDYLLTVGRIPFVGTSSVRFGGKVVSRPSVGGVVGQFIRKVGQWYVTFIFVLVLHVVGIDIVTARRATVSAHRYARPLFRAA